MDDDSECYVRKALWFCPKQLQHSRVKAPPINGHQYLYDVVQEAAEIPHVLKREDFAKMKSLQTYTIPRDDLPQLSSDMLPSAEWQREQVADFSEIRRLVERRRLLEESTSDDNMPLDKGYWKHYFFEVDGNIHSPPRMNQLFLMSQIVMCRLLKVFIEWLDEGIVRLDSKEGALIPWLYSILACLELPLIPDTCSDMRQLARHCHTTRHKLKTESSDVSVTPLNLLICIIGKYFEQFDLAD